ncbi:MAG: hypothetical protein BroJett040_18020 [Oligoflexia bacterium]|nr:MAG: hypothetical protein BroJett040_18020 [Oligoflexia bacterium]
MKNMFKILFSLIIVLSMANCATHSATSREKSQGGEISDIDTPDSDSELDADLENPDADKRDAFADFEEKEPPREEPAPIAQEEPPPVVEEPPPPVVEEAPGVAQDVPAESSQAAHAADAGATTPSEGLVNLKNIQYKANDSGGTIIVDADGPMTYSTRMNEQNQYIIEIPNSLMPKKLMRPLVTKDFDGYIGSIDAYQKKGSNISRIVVQLKQGAVEPVVQSEGNSLLVVANEINQPVTPVNSKLLSYDSLDEFLAGNMTFYGRKISIETDDMELRDVFKMISEEGGVNLVIADEVRGRMSLKLRQVPWDQALVMIMKAKKLSYTRTGNVLRIAPVADLRAEEDDAIKIANAKKNMAPLKVKMIPVSYAKVDELEKQVKPFLSERGKLIADLRTSSLVVSDIDENIEQAEKLVRSIDVPPQQVLIEGKIVEAKDEFERQIGVQWQTTGRSTRISGVSSSAGQVRGSTSMSVTPGSISGSTMGINFQMGTLDILGDLSATLTLKESEGLVKVLSSPRVVTIHNEPAEISQTTELPLITSTTSATGAVSPTVTFKPVRLKLNVTPQITNDGSVIMGVDVNREFAGQVVSPETQARPINSRAAKTKVIVHNGQTAVIGGIYQNDSQEGETRVPWLGNLPVVGWLFKTKTKSFQKNELLIFLTPRILGQLDSQAIPNQSGGDF